MKRSSIKKLILFALFISFIGINVYAETTSKLHFCEYRGTLRMLKMIGMLIIFAKTVVPIILIYKGIKELTQVVIGNKGDAMKEAVGKLVKSVIAGLAIFFVPTIVNYTINMAVENSENAEMAECSKSLLEINSCTTPETDPEVTTRD